MPLPRGMGIQPQPPRYGDIDHHGERRSRRDWCEMLDFEEEGNDRLDSFFDHVKELADFYQWDERETCRQACAHLGGHVPIKGVGKNSRLLILLKCFQPRDLTATYQAQFRSRCTDVIMRTCIRMSKPCSV